MKVYIAGLMTNDDEINEFHVMAKRLVEQGHTPINPAEMDITTPTVTRDGVVRRDILALLDADAIVLLHRWNRATGAQAEAAVARWRNIPRLDRVTLEKVEW